MLIVWCPAAVREIVARRFHFLTVDMQDLDCLLGQSAGQLRGDPVSSFQVLILGGKKGEQLIDWSV